MCFVYKTVCTTTDTCAAWFVYAFFKKKKKKKTLEEKTHNWLWSEKSINFLMGEKNKIKTALSYEPRGGAGNSYARPGSDTQRAEMDDFLLSME